MVSYRAYRTSLSSSHPLSSLSFTPSSEIYLSPVGSLSQNPTEGGTMNALYNDLNRPI